MDNEIKENVGKEVDFVDEHGEKATMQIESATGYNINLFNHGKYKLANSRFLTI